jgi:DNA-binding beta-propeller fold protein YncE
VLTLRNERLILRVLVAVVVISTMSELGCTGFFGPSSPPPAPPPGGFSVAVNVDNGTGFVSLDPSATVQAWKSANICSSSGNPIGSSCPPVGTVLQTNGYIGNNQYISGAVVAAGWSGTFRSNTLNASGGKCDPVNGTGWGPTPIWIRGSSNTVATCFTGLAAGQFFAANSVPTSLTVQASGFSTASGMPQFNLYSLKKGQLTQLTATSVSGTGAATFSFPKNSNGTSLGTGIYSYVVSNKTSGGISPFASGLLSIGSIDTSHQTPMGIDAATQTTNSQTCQPINQYGTIGCTSSSSTNIIPVYTLETPGQVCGSACVTVGGQPVQVKVFASASKTYGGMTNGIGGTATVTGPGLVAAANYTNNAVNIVNVFNDLAGLVATVNVGLQPTSLILNSSNTKAYVANFGSASISEVSLTSPYTQTRVANVGSSPAALVMDPSGNSIWVGGSNYISQIDLTSFAVSSTIAVTGQVTALGISSGQNQFIYSTVTNSGANANFAVSHAQFVTGANARADYQFSISSSSPLARSYALAVTDASSPPGWVSAGGVLVSAAYGNRYVVNGTPTGFLVMDLQSGLQMLQAATASPVRGIATDPAQGTVFLTAPDSNSLITLPLPVVQTN